MAARPVTVNMKNSGYDLSRAVRSDRYKFIYNCTPWIPYSPVDSAGGAGWKQMIAASTERHARSRTGRHLFHHAAPGL